MTEQDKFYRIADAILREIDPDPEVYGMVVDAVQRGYNLRAIEDLEGE